MSEKELTTGIISEYYKDHFDFSTLLSYIGLTNFNKREFGFVVPSGRFIRNISFPNTNALRQFMVENSVLHAYIGAVYSTSPSRDNPIQKIEWKYREFIFDLDIDEYDLVRTCGCKGYEFCFDCWSLIKDAVIFIDETMKKDFGYTDIRWLFSGRRGVHGWIIDKRAQTYDQKIRTAILNYLGFIHDKKRSQSIDEIPDSAKSLRNRIYSIIAKAYFLNVTQKELKTIGLSAQQAKYIIERVRNSKEFDHLTYNQIVPIKPEIRAKLSNEIILCRYPRIDRKVTMDTRRVSRMPLSIHGKTGNIAIEIDDIIKFDPFKVKTVWDVIK